jgi:ABC-type transport system involved in multi-copper enzyme maturation permease subunit
MLLGPVFSSELVTTARRTRYYFVRVAYATILLVILWGNYASVTSYTRALSIRQSAELAHLYFTWFAFLQLAAVLLLGPAMAAGTIASERERGTIEYLFVTHLSNHEIVFDKLAARLLLIAYIALVGMPVIWIFRLLGGVSAGFLLLSFLVTASTMITVAAVSVCISVWSPRARDAVMRAYLVLIAALLLPLIILAWFGSGMISGRLVDVLGQVNQWLLTINPFWVMGAALGWGGRVTGAAVDWTIVQRMALGQLTIAAICVVLATLAVRRVHARSVGGAPRRRWELRLPRRRRSLGRHPMLWKELFTTSTANLGAAGRIALALVVVGVVVTSVGVFTSALSSTSLSRWLTPAFYYAVYLVYMGTPVSCGLLLLLAASAATSVTSEKERQTWDALLATPLSARQIVTAKIVGNLYAVRWLFALLLAIWLPELLLAPDFVLVLPIVFGTLLILAWYASSLGVLLSITCRTSLRAMAATLTIIIMAGGGYFFVCCLPILIGSSSDSGIEIILAPCIPFLLALPGALYSTVRAEQSWGEWELVVAYLLGMMGYSVAAVLLTFSAIVNFDRLTGRSQLDLYPLSDRYPPCATAEDESRE